MITLLSNNLRCDKQVWSNMTRYLLISEHGSVQLECYPEEQNFKSRVWLYGLCIDEKFRRRGFATDLMIAALDLLRAEGYENVSLDWNSKDTPEGVLDWYQRLGFKIIEFNYSRTHFLLKKNLLSK